MASEGSRVLLIEDDKDFLKILAVNFRDAGFVVESSELGTRGLGMAVAQNYDLVIMDLGLPDLEGITICRQLRQIKPHIPLIILTSRKAEKEKLCGFDAGADDYVTKPCSMAELIARAQALLRRSSPPKPKASEEIKIGNFSIDLSSRVATKSGKVLDMTATEFDLLAFFAAHPGKVFSREELLNGVWGYNCDGYENTVNVHINRLRSKIEEDPADPQCLLTVWGVGYKLVDSLATIAAAKSEKGGARAR